VLTEELAWKRRLARGIRDPDKQSGVNFTGRLLAEREAWCVEKG
jgi:hypothetical protein